MTNGAGHRFSIFLLIALVLAGSLVPARAEWWETLTTTKGTFPSLRPMRAHYRFGWAMVPAAEADFTLARLKGDITKLTVTTQTIGMVRGTWKMNSEAVSEMNTATLRPISLRQKEVYRKETETTKVDYTDTEVKRIRESIPAHGTPRTKKFEFQNVFDLHSAFHFLRGQRLADKDVYSLVVYPSTDPYLAKVEVQGHTQMKISGAQQKVIKIDLKLSKVDRKDFTLKPHEKFKRATIFLGDDANRLLLRIEGELAVGSVWCELDKVEFTKP